MPSDLAARDRVAWPSRTMLDAPKVVTRVTSVWRFSHMFALCHAALPCDSPRCVSHVAGTSEQRRSPHARRLSGNLNEAQLARRSNCRSLSCPVPEAATQNQSNANANGVNSTTFKTRLSLNTKMVDTNSTFGFEILQALYDNQIAKKEDVLILFVHWYFVKNGFKCIGLGDSKAYDSSETASELLPEGWNKRLNYALRYLNEGKLYILHGTRSDEDLLLNLLRVDNQSVSNTQYPINRTVNNLHGPLESLMPSYPNVLQAVQRDLVSPLLPNNTTETSTQTSTSEHSIATEPDADPLRVGPSARPRLVTQPWAPEIDPSRVGGADLNPFARGGGMIFDPFNPSARNPLDPLRPGVGIPGRLPPGAVPPYARFDPFGPPDNNPPRPRRNPDSDDAMPPGYDDMFM